jgi:hypothetical protein
MLICRVFYGSDGTRTRDLPRLAQVARRPRARARATGFRAPQGEEIGGRRKAGDGSALRACMTEPADRGRRYPKPCGVLNGSDGTRTRGLRRDRPRRRQQRLTTKDDESRLQTRIPALRRRLTASRRHALLTRLGHYRASTKPRLPGASSAPQQNAPRLKASVSLRSRAQIRPHQEGRATRRH